MSRDYVSPYLPSFDFNDADLAANRQGELTPQQDMLVESVYQARQKGARQTVIAFLIFFAILLLVGSAIEFSKSGQNVGSFISSTGGIYLFVIILFSIIVLINLLFTWHISQDAKKRHISTVEGVAQPLMAEAHYRGSSYMRYELRLKKGRLTRKLFRFPSERSVSHFTERKTYRIYYIGFYPFDIVLSAEEI